jgi:predicted Zn-ribbon and HTH transcriptional regulator
VSGTPREEIHRALCEGFATARDLSRRVGVPERDVAWHLEHLERSARQRGERLVTEESRCLACGFAFPGRRRFTRPGRCAKCGSTRLSLPRFRIEGGQP